MLCAISKLDSLHKKVPAQSSALLTRLMGLTDLLEYTQEVSNKKKQFQLLVLLLLEVNTTAVVSAVVHLLGHLKNLTRLMVAQELLQFKNQNLISLDKVRAEVCPKGANLRLFRKKGIAKLYQHQLLFKEMIKPQRISGSGSRELLQQIIFNIAGKYLT